MLIGFLEFLKRSVKLQRGPADSESMDSSAKQRDDAVSDLDWANLVKEMETIKDRVEQNLDAESESVREPSEAATPSDDPAPAPAPAEEYAPMEEMLSGVGREELDAELDAEAQGKVIPLAAAAPASASHSSATSEPAPVAADAIGSALSLAVVGALKIRLELTRQSQTVQIHLEEDQLRVELSDGMQFRIPLNKAA